MSPALARFCAFYRALGPGRPTGLDEIYSREIEFIDPAHQLTGLNAVEQYFERLLGPLHTCAVEIEQVMEQEQSAYVRWTMHLSHPALARGQPIEVPGVSYLRFAERIDYHRDYFDLGALVYEHLPLVGGAVRAFKARLGQ